MSGVLWHYTCAHAHEAIGEAGTLLPPVAVVPRRVAKLTERMPEVGPLFTMVWATDLEAPDADALGLTRFALKCDRTAYRYAVPAEGFARWGWVRGRYAREVLDLLELANGAEPARWWVSFDPVPATYAPMGATP